MRTLRLPLLAKPCPHRIFSGALGAMSGLAIVAGAAGAEVPMAPPVEGGRIGTIEVGAYGCETPGDATGSVGKPYAQLAFLIVNSSSYRSKGQRGSYLLTGRTMIMTDGPLKGTRLHHVSRTRLQLLDDRGQQTEVRCVRSGPTF